jgi:hypothetical protein
MGREGPDPGLLGRPVVDDDQGVPGVPGEARLAPGPDDVFERDEKVGALRPPPEGF